MDLINQIGISYRASYLLQGTQAERCKTSTKLQAYNTELKIRSDGKDFDIANILKDYRGNIIFNVPSINADLGNLKSICSKVKSLANNNVKMITINASNLSLDIFEWSTVEEQKKYFLNIVTSIATLASNKIIVALENMEPDNNNEYFGSNIQQISDIIVYSKKVLIKDFGFNENDANKYIGLCLNIDKVINNENIDGIKKWFKVFNKNIRCIKISSNNYENSLDIVLDECIKYGYGGPILLQTDKELEEIEPDYKYLDEKIRKLLQSNNMEISENKIKPIDDAGYTNIIVLSIIVVTIFIAILMVLVKIKS